jgi:hypothetical protein
MFRKIVSVLAIAPLALNFVAIEPTQAQIQAAIFVPCDHLVSNGATFYTQATYPRDPNTYSGPLRITRVRGSNWSGVLNLNNQRENVRGTISGTRFTLSRRSGQHWSASCYAGGQISGNFTKHGARAVGSFSLTPRVARR